MPDIISLLLAERDRLDRAIAALQGTGPRRGRPPGRRGPGRPPARRGPGRPPKAPGSGEQSTLSKGLRRRGHMSAAARKRQSERMKAYWAAKRRGTKS